MTRRVLRFGLLCRGVGRFAVFYLFGAVFAFEGAQAKYLVDEGKGYALCERLKYHLNGSVNFKKGKGGEVMPDLEFMKKIMAFPGFTRPISKNIPLADIKDLIVLMGEVDYLQFSNNALYAGSKEGVEKYIEDRRLNKISPEILEKSEKIGYRYYKDLSDGKADVYRIIDSHKLADQTLLQIEYLDVDGDANVILRHVDDDLKIPRPKDSNLDWPRPNNALVSWRGNYYVIFGDRHYFEIKANSNNVFPQICRFWRKD